MIECGRPSSAEAGFTLLEMVVVLMVLSLALGIVLARGPMRNPTLEIRSTAGELKQAMRAARGRAIMLGRPVRMTVDLVRRAYRVDDAPERGMPSALAISVLAASGEVIGDRFAGISFAPDGSSSGGHVELSDGHLGLRVTVDWLTGRVSITGNARGPGGVR